MKELIKAAVVAWLPRRLDKINELTPELRTFIVEAVVEYIEERL